MKKKIPWGVFASLCGIFAFYSTAIVVICYIIFSQIAATTGQVATLFDSWWQTTLFVFDILMIVGFIGFLVLFILRKKGEKKNENEHI